MSIEFSATARRLGIISATVTGALLVAYAGTLGFGLATLEAPDQPIGDPMFTILEVLIITMMPAMVGLMVAVHAWAPQSAKALSLVSVIFMGLLAGLTCSLHFVILTISRQPSFAEQSWLPMFMSFQWPSVVYALDILGWDIFFALSMLFAAPVFNGSRLAVCIRVTMFTSAGFALAGLPGVALGNMQVRNLGIIGYVGVFLVVCVLLAVHFWRARPVASDSNDSLDLKGRES